MNIEEIIIKQLSEEHLSEEESAFFDKWYQDSSNWEYYNDLLKMVNLLEEICFVNRGKYGIIALFEKINDNNYNIIWNIRKKKSI